MRILFRCILTTAALFAVAPAANAGELTLQMANGRVTLIAQDVPLREILAEWARVGDARMVNAEKLPATPTTLQLIDVPEKEALDILLRSAAGYMTAQRPVAAAGASLYDRVIILATSRPPAPTVTAAPAPFGNRPVIPQPLPQPADEDDAQGAGVMPQPVVQPFPGQMPVQQQPFPGAAPMQQPFPGAAPMQQPVPGAAPAGPQPFPGAPPVVQPYQPYPGPTPPMPQQPLTSPRPGVLPQPQPDPNNPYAPVRPGGRGGGPEGA